MVITGFHDANVSTFQQRYLSVLTDTIDSDSIVSMAKQILCIIQTAAFKPLRHVRYILALIDDLCKTFQQTNSVAIMIHNVQTRLSSNWRHQKFVLYMPLQNAAGREEEQDPVHKSLCHLVLNTAILITHYSVTLLFYFTYPQRARTIVWETGLR